MDQTHPALDVWLLDDHSTDGSREIIQELQRENPSLHIYLSPENIGHNRLFNKFLGEYRGDALIDLAADDILLPGRVAAGVEALSMNPACGVHFTNAELIDEAGQHAGWHYPVDDDGKSIVPVPTGDVFSELVSRYFINPVTMMMRKSVLDELDGFDESLSYEDFDFWVRSSRCHPYCYTDKVLVRRRIHPESFSRQQYRFGSIQMRDTFRVCQKLKGMLHTPAEQRAFHLRLGYEMRQCLRKGNLKLFADYLQLL